MPKYKRRNYQKKGINKQINFLKRFGGFLNASEPGTGKTCQAIGVIEERSLPVVIVCPATLKENWVIELGIWLDFEYTTYIVEGSPKPATIKKAMEADFVIINYDIMVSKGNEADNKNNWCQILKKRKFKFMICDESHYIKNPKSKMTQGVMELNKSVRFRGFLSATPITSNPADLFPVLHMIDPKRFPTYREFGAKYSYPSFDGRSQCMKYKGARNEDELHKILKYNYRIRFRKEDILKELPPKTFNYIKMTLDREARREYETCRDGFIKYVEGRPWRQINKTEALSRLGQLRISSAKGKLKESIKWIRDFLDGSDEKLVVMGVHKIILNEIEKEFKDICVKINGDVPVKQRQGLIEKFQKDPKCRLFIGNIKSAGVGITLTASCNLAFVELSYVPAEMVQAIDRIHRIGQTRKHVNIYFLLAKNTIDEKIAAINDEKSKIASKIVDGRKLPAKELITYLMAS